MPACQEPSDRHWGGGGMQDWQVTWAQTRVAEEEGGQAGTSELKVVGRPGALDPRLMNVG